MKYSLAERKVITQEPSLFLPIGYGGIADGDFGKAENDYRSVGDVLNRFSPFRSKTNKANVFGATLSNLMSSCCYRVLKYEETPVWRSWYEHYLCTLQYVAGDALPLTMKAWLWPDAATSPEWTMTIQETLPDGWTGVSELHLVFRFVNGTNGLTDSYTVRAKRTVDTYEEWLYSYVAQTVGGTKTVTNILQGRDHTPYYGPHKLIVRRNGKTRMLFRFQANNLAGGTGYSYPHYKIKNSAGTVIAEGGQYGGGSRFNQPGYWTAWLAVDIPAGTTPGNVWAQHMVNAAGIYIYYYGTAECAWSIGSGSQSFSADEVPDPYPFDIVGIEWKIDPDNQWYDVYAVVNGTKEVGTYMWFQGDTTNPMVYPYSPDPNGNGTTITAVGAEIPYGRSSEGKIFNPILIGSSGLYLKAGVGSSPELSTWSPIVYFTPNGADGEWSEDWSLVDKPYPSYYTGQETYNTMPDSETYQSPVMVFEQVAETITSGSVSATTHSVKVKTDASVGTTQVLVRQSTNSTNRIHHIGGTNNGYSANYCLYSDDEGIHSFTVTYTSTVANVKNLVPPDGYTFGDSVFCGKLYKEDLETVYASTLMLVDVVKDGLRSWGIATSPTTPTVTVLPETHPKDGTLVSADARERCQGVWYEYYDPDETIEKRRGIAFWGWKASSASNSIWYQE